MAMSSLTPGVLFKSSGLNQRHTPTQITATSENVKTKYRRASIPEKTWPPESPVAQVYDIRNTSSGLIILNNRMSKKSHLRVQSGRYKSSSDSGDDKAKRVEPTRHFMVNMTRSDRHDICHDSSSPVFQPTPSRPHTSDSPRHNPKYRYPATPGAPTPSEWHHYSSQVDRPSRAYSAPLQRGRSAGPKRQALEPPPCFSGDKRWLFHPDMTYGQKKYMNSIAHTYDVTDMKQLKQAQYLQLIYREKQRALYFFTPEEYKRYLKYLSSERTRQFNTKPPPPTHYRTNGKIKKAKVTPRDSRRQSDAGRGEADEIERVKEAQPKQSAPKPAHQRQRSSPVSVPTNRGKDEGAKRSNDDREYMMYSDPENPKKSTGSRRPKSSKSKGTRKSERGIISSDDEMRSNKESEDRYWQQPAAPLKETEPDGSGLSMTKEGKLRRDGEGIEAISSEHTEDKVKPAKAPVKVVDPKKDPKPFTYDIEHGDGTKTRVYAPPIEKAHKKDDIPIVKEEEIKPMSQKPVKESVEEDGEEVVMDRAWKPVETDTESTRVKNSGSIE